jgi:uncharacterized alpha/beta hydrolase family protein
MIVYAYTDIFARYLLGDEKNSDLLLYFINSVNEDNNLPLLKRVTIKNPFNLKSLVREKESIIDVKDHLQSRWLLPDQKDVEGTAFKSREYW